MEGLTRREREALRYVIRGFTNRETARAMNCGARTVEDYRLRILKKYKARNAVELVRAFYNLDAVDAASVLSQSTPARGS